MNSELLIKNGSVIDPAIGIDWPGEVRVISDRDRDYPDCGS